MRVWGAVLVSLAIASTAAGIEPQRVAAVDQSLSTSAPPLIDFPAIAVDQTRGISSNVVEPDYPIPPDETGGSSATDPCKSGKRYHDQRCLKDTNYYYCTSANAIGRQCGMYLEGTNSQICKTCIN